MNDKLLFSTVVNSLMFTPVNCGNASKFAVGLVICYHSSTKLWEGNVFSRVC